jgi:HK97 family phage major capsid protein
MNVEEKRSLWEMAVQRLEDLTVQLEHLGPDPDAAVRETLEERFNDAKKDALKAREDFERAQQVAQVRSLTIPREDNDDDGRSSAPRWSSSARTRRGSPSAAMRRRTVRTTRTATSSSVTCTGRRRADQGARERIQRCRRELQVERRDLSSTDTAGGDFVSPLYAVNDWINVVRMGRPFANVVNTMPLPDNTDTIIWPKVTSGTATSAQADLGAVQETDPVTAQVSVGVKTVAGQVDVSQQLLDRSQPGIDQILFADLRADYNVRIDLQCLSGSGSGANAKGVLSDTNRTQVTYTDASPTVGELYSKIQDAVPAHPGRPWAPGEHDRHAPAPLGVDRGGDRLVRPSADRSVRGVPELAGCW